MPVFVYAYLIFFVGLTVERDVLDVCPLIVHMEIYSQAAESAVNGRVECREQFRTSGTKMEIIKMTTGMLQWSYQWFVG